MANMKTFNFNTIMKAKALFLVPLLAFVACTSNDPKSNNSVQDNSFKYKILFEGDSPYLTWYFSDMESFVSYKSCMYPINVTGQFYERVSGAEDNTITIKDDLKVHIHDDYVLKGEDDITTLQITRTADILKQGSDAPLRAKQDGNSGAPQTDPHTYTYTIQTAMPITLIRPLVDNCDPIPLCYYDGFEIEWNEDQQNENGVVVVAEWNGATMYGPSQTVTIANVDIVEDNGLAILNTDLFEDMPDEALVTLWLIRGDLITISGDGEITLPDLLSEDTEAIEYLLETYPELSLQLRPYMFGTGAVTSFSFFLIREL